MGDKSPKNNQKQKAVADKKKQDKQKKPAQSSVVKK
jgi:hypothetical protein